MANEHAKCLINLGATISSVISRKNSNTVENFKSLYDIEHEFFNLSDILFNKDIWDAAIICCSEEFIFSYTEKLAQTGKPLLVEKPISSDLKELEKLVHYENIKVGFNRRFYKNVSFLKSELKKIETDLVKICLPESKVLNKLDNKKILPEEIFSNSIHIFDLLFYLFGDISWNSFLFSKSKKNLRSCSFLGLNEEGTNFTLDMPFNYPDNFSISIYSDESKYVLKPIEILSIFKGMKIIEPSDELPHRIYEPRLQSKILAESKKNFKSGLLEQDKAFVEFCKSKKANNKLANVVDSYKALKSIVKIEDLLRK